MLLLLKKITVFQRVALIVLLIDFIDNLVNHSYFLCAYDIFLFMGLMFYLTIHIRKIKIPDSISSSTLDLYSIIKIEITDEEIILILPNKTITDNLTDYTGFIIIKNGIFLTIDSQNQKTLKVAYIRTNKFSSPEKQKLIHLFYDKRLKRV